MVVGVDGGVGVVREGEIVWLWLRVEHGAWTVVGGNMCVWEALGSSRLVSSHGG